jgi:glycosyltransferase involved in cell wall biosynthesis
MASGIVPICAREGGAYGIIRNGVTGYTAKPRDAPDMVRHIEYLCDHQDHYRAMAAGALAFARSQTWEAVIHRLAGSYREVLAETDEAAARGRTKAA